MSKTGREVLIVTLPPSIMGGVATKTRLLADYLRRKSYVVTLAHYAPWKSEGRRNATFLGSLIGRKPTMRFYREWNGLGFVSVGCKYPELEATYYYNSPFWPGIVEEHDFHIAVGGNVLPATPLVTAEVPHLIWCASDVMGDRIDRHRAMNTLRRYYDKKVVIPRLLELEQTVLAGNGHFMTVSKATEGVLRGIAPKELDAGQLSIPVDTNSFTPVEQPPEPGTIGSAGRHTDSRKNTAMLIKAVAVAHQNGQDLKLRLAGPHDEALPVLAKRLHISDHVEFLGDVPTKELPDFYRSLDVFAIPSHQEGLNIAGLEAMACGVPVVSTRCGGPEDYVMNGVTGLLCDTTPEDLAAKLTYIVGDRKKREIYSGYARAIVLADYSLTTFKEKLKGHWQATFNKPLA